MFIQPGHSDVATYERKEIRAVLGHEILLAAVLAPTSIALEIGTILGYETDTLQMKVYKNDATDGSEKAQVVLAHPVSPSTLPQNVQVYVEGIFYKDSLIGLDDEAIKHLHAREAVPNLIII